MAESDAAVGPDVMPMRPSKCLERSHPFQKVAVTMPALETDNSGDTAHGSDSQERKFFEAAEVLVKGDGLAFADYPRVGDEPVGGLLRDADTEFRS